jgi:hypothetical protein
MQMSESAALVRALRLINKTLERVEKIIDKIHSRDNKGGGTQSIPARLTLMKKQRGRNIPKHSN